MYETIEYEKAILTPNSIFIDVRSPEEAEKDPMPGAINMPVLLDEERKQVGILYKEKKIDQAKLFAVISISKRLPHIFEKLIKLNTDYGKMYFFCARGGYRSSVLTSFLYSLDLNAYKIQGGYKAYRKYITTTMDNLIEGISPIVLYGNTGSGKTLLLNQLEKQGYPVIDLEAMAKHRGSLLGSVGLGQQHSQKKFDSLLHDKLKEYQGSYVFFEGESKRIGKVFMTDSLYDKMGQGISIEIQCPMDQRIKQLVDEYAHQNHDELVSTVEKLGRYISKEKIDNFKILLEEKNYGEVAKQLCINYYDLNYKTRVEKYDYIVENNDIIQCSNKLISIYEKIVSQE